MSSGSHALKVCDTTDAVQAVIVLTPTLAWMGCVVGDKEEVTEVGESIRSCNVSRTRSEVPCLAGREHTQAVPVPVTVPGQYY